MKKKVKKFIKIGKKKDFTRIVLFVLVLVFFILIWSLFFLSRPEFKIAVCGDGTLGGKCSDLKPYFCLNGTLVERASVCGCPELLSRYGNVCLSQYQSNPKNISLEYILRGERGEINFVAYEGMYNYLLNLPNSFYYSNGNGSIRQNFKFKKINEAEQRELLLPLVVEIQNAVSDKTEQARIAISLVQRIPYKESEKTIVVGFNRINYSRFAYEVLYEMQGACEGRSELLAFLLKELGYGVGLFYYPMEDHEAVGINCPNEFSLNDSEYCFIETTGPSILSNYEEYYLGLGKLTSEPEVIFISDGESLGSDLYEYKDAKEFIKLSDLVEERGELNIFRHYKYNALKEKYGLQYKINL